jgi:hypothetical protein
MRRPPPALSGPQRSTARAVARPAALAPLLSSSRRHHRRPRATAADAAAAGSVAVDEAALAALEAATSPEALAALLDGPESSYLTTPLATVALMNACMLPPPTAAADDADASPLLLPQVLSRLAAASRPHAAALPLASRAQLALALARHPKGPIYDRGLFSAIAEACAADLEEEAAKRKQRVTAAGAAGGPQPSQQQQQEEEDEDLDLASTLISLFAAFAMAGHYDERLFSSLCAAAVPLLRPGGGGGGGGGGDGGGVLRAEPRALCALARAMADAQHYDAAALREIADAAAEHGPEAFAALGGAERRRGGDDGGGKEASDRDDDDGSSSNPSRRWRLEELGGLLQSLAFLRAPGRAPFVAACLSFCSTAGDAAWRRGNKGGKRRRQSREAVGRLWRAAALLKPQLPSLARRLGGAGGVGGEAERQALARMQRDLDALLGRLAAEEEEAGEEGEGGDGGGGLPLACAPPASASALLLAAVELQERAAREEEKKNKTPALPLSRALATILEGAGKEREADWRRSGLLAPAEVAARLEEVLAALAAVSSSSSSSPPPRLLLPTTTSGAARAGPNQLLRLDLAVDAPPAPSAVRAALASSSPPPPRRRVAVLVLPPSAYCSAVVTAAASSSSSSSEDGSGGGDKALAAERLRGAAAADVLILRGSGYGVMAVPTAEWVRLAGARGAARRRDGGGEEDDGDALAALQAEYLGSRLAAGLAEAATAAGG